MISSRGELSADDPVCPLCLLFRLWSALRTSARFWSASAPAALFMSVLDSREVATTPDRATRRESGTGLPHSKRFATTTHFRTSARFLECVRPRLPQPFRSHFVKPPPAWPEAADSFARSRPGTARPRTESFPVACRTRRHSAARDWRADGGRCGSASLRRPDCVA